ncbi:MAG: phosphate ABC transporter permease subunit PstC, partial [Planctomycetota bacterium]
MRKTDALGISSLLLAGGAVLSLLAAAVLLVWQSVPVWRHEGLLYLTGDTWFFRRDVYGALPMLWGTVAVAGVAVVLAAPLGIGAAIFTSEVLPPRLRVAVKVLIELLAGVPSVVYGLLGVLLLRGYVYKTMTWLGLSPLSGDTLLTAGL